MMVKSPAPRCATSRMPRIIAEANRVTVTSSEMKPMLIERMRGASAGKTMYVIPYLMSPPGSPLESYAAGVNAWIDGHPLPREFDQNTLTVHLIFEYQR